MLFAITKSDSEDFETFIIEAGEELNEAAVHVFTEVSIARQFLKDGELTDEYGVAEFSAGDLPGFLSALHDNEVTLLCVNASAEDEQAEMLEVAPLLQELGEAALSIIKPEA